MANNSVKTQRQEHKDELKGVQRNYDAIGGERPIKAKTVDYLPPIPAHCTITSVNDNGEQTISLSLNITPEGQRDYNQYLALAKFFGATGRTVDGLSGLIFSKKPVVKLPKAIEYMEYNCDGRGTSLRDFAKSVCVEVMSTPRSGVLVAMPPTPAGASVKDKEDKNIRPKLLHYKHNSIINWDHGVSNNETKLSLAVLKECTTKRNGFDVEAVDRYRVLELVDGVYSQAMYDEDGEILEPQASVIRNGDTTSTIPFYLFENEKPMISELADANIHHYQVGASYYSKLFFSSFAIFYETGTRNGQSTNMSSGHGIKWNGGDGASFGVLQADGNGDGLQIAWDKGKADMAALGAQHLQEKSAMAESAEAKSIDNIAQNTTTADVAIQVSDIITKALKDAAEWQGANSDDVEFSLNTDYNPTGMDAQSLLARWTVYTGGGMTFDEFHKSIQQGEVISTQQTSEEAKAIIDAEQAGMSNAVVE